MMKPFKAIYLLVSYLHALLKSNFILAYDIVTPGSMAYPDIVEVNLETKKDIHLFILCCMVTMTPGTLTLKINEEKTKLWVHSLYNQHPKEVLAGIMSWQKTIREVF